MVGYDICFRVKLQYTFFGDLKKQNIKLPIY